MSVDSLYAISYTYKELEKSVFIAKIDSRRTNIISNSSSNVVERDTRLNKMFREEVVVLYHDRDTCIPCHAANDGRCGEHYENFRNINITAINKLT